MIRVDSENPGPYFEPGIGPWLQGVSWGLPLMGDPNLILAVTSNMD